MRLLVLIISLMVLACDTAPPCHPQDGRNVVLPGQPRPEPIPGPEEPPDSTLNPEEGYGRNEDGEVCRCTLGQDSGCTSDPDGIEGEEGEPRPRDPGASAAPDATGDAPRLAQCRVTWPPDDRVTLWQGTVRMLAAAEDECDRANGWPESGVKCSACGWADQSTSGTWDCTTYGLCHRPGVDDPRHNVSGRYSDSTLRGAIRQSQAAFESSCDSLGGRSEVTDTICTAL